MAYNPYKKVVIGVLGKARAGKDTLAGCFAGRVVTRNVALATPLYKYVADMMGTTIEELRKPNYKEHIRPLLQQVADSTRKVIGDSTFALKARKEFENTEDFVIITDVRYESDMEVIARLREFGWLVLFVSVERDNKLKASGRAHSSEKLAGNLEYVPIDYKFNNNSSIADLQSQVDVFLTQFLDKKVLERDNNLIQSNNTMNSKLEEWRVTRINDESQELELKPWRH